MALAAVLGSGAFATSDGAAVPGGRRATDRDGGLPLVQTSPVVVRDIPYAEQDGQVLALDVYRMEDADVGAALILVHGGSWRRRSKEIWSPLASVYAREGYVVFAIDYRLAPPGGYTRFPAPVEDVHAAVDWVRRNASAYGADAARVAVAGSSAGAHLALMAAGSEGMRPDAVVLFSAPVDLSRLHRRDVIRNSIENFVGCAPEVCPRTYRSASGRRAMDSSTPPILVVFSRHELIPPDQPLRLVQRLQALGRPVETVELGGTRHGMAVASVTSEETLEFLDRRL